MNWRNSVSLIVLALACGSHPTWAEEPATAPTTAPAATAPSPEATQLINKVKSAYGKLSSLKMNGKLSANLDVAGKTQNRETDFSSEYQAPDLYRHTVKNELVAGSTGKSTYILEVPRNVFVTQEAPKQKTSYRQLPGMMGELLDVQDPGLLLAVSANSVSDLLEGATKIQTAPDTKLGEGSLPTLSYTAVDGRNVQLTFDPKTSLLQQATYDLSGLMKSRGAEQVNQAIVTIRYTGVEPNVALDKGSFAWTPPANAREAASNDSDETATLALQGKPAPDFTLTGLDGKEVTLSSLKGNVVLLDFWATWCPPCVRSLPEINAIYQARKASGLQVFAVNLGETKDQVQNFLTQKKLTLPVLLDSEQKVGEKYAIQGIPCTIIIKPTGVVSKVFVGIAPGGRTEIEREIDAAAK